MFNEFKRELNQIIASVTLFYHNLGSMKLNQENRTPRRRRKEKLKIQTKLIYYLLALFFDNARNNRCNYYD